MHRLRSASITAAARDDVAESCSWLAMLSEGSFTHGSGVMNAPVLLAFVAPRLLNSGAFLTPISYVSTAQQAGCKTQKNHLEQQQ